jgi:hypothetical protein
MARTKNGNLTGRAARHNTREQFTSPNDDVLAQLKGLMPYDEYMDFFNFVYEAFRWSNYDQYCQILRDKLVEVRGE